MISLNHMNNLIRWLHKNKFLELWFSSQNWLINRKLLWHITLASLEVLGLNSGKLQYCTSGPTFTQVSNPKRGTHAGVWKASPRMPYPGVWKVTPRTPLQRNMSGTYQSHVRKAYAVRRRALFYPRMRGESSIHFWSGSDTIDYLGESTAVIWKHKK